MLALLYLYACLAEVVVTDKDYQLVNRPSPMTSHSVVSRYGKVAELSSVKEFGTHMESRGILDWWRKGMGYA
jgi:hypothetical protein